ncbi:MAG: OmpA family protein [Deltaproteobacteria bacterium]|nr:OmpA family protein [Deltaproteobacteria bacterium]
MRAPATAFVLVVSTLTAAAAPAPAGPPASGGVLAPARSSVDFVTFAQGAQPLSLSIDGVASSDLEGAIRAIDGAPTPFVLVRAGKADSVVEIVYLLPAPTRFDAFAVPTVTEVPSRATTFLRTIEVSGSATGADTGFQVLAAATLTTHKKRGLVSPLKVTASPAVRWLKLRMTGGLVLPDGKASLQFSELEGYGRQDAVALATGFKAIWSGKGVLIELSQSGATVSGCYDSDGGQLQGTVSGNILRAVGVDPGDKVTSVFVLMVGADGGLRGLRSTNGAPFRIYQGDPAPAGTTTRCSAPPPKLGCGSVIHAVNFDFDSARIRPDSEPVLAELHRGLAADKSQSIVVEGHTSSEGRKDHNQALSLARAQAVVDDLVRRGLDKRRLRAAGRGPDEPIASNQDEAGRALNRRVEIQCK